MTSRRKTLAKRVITPRASGVFKKIPGEQGAIYIVANVREWYTKTLGHNVDVNLSK